jgi:hypothetical protein
MLLSFKCCDEKFLLENCWCDVYSYLGFVKEDQIFQDCFLFGGISLMADAGF